jgi:general secretion pathway protein J
MSHRRRSRNRRGVTLIEIMVALGVLSIVASLVYGAFDSMSRTRKSVDAASERYHQGRGALSRMGREIQAAFLSLHRPLINTGVQSSQTIFKGTNSGTLDRLDFCSFSHRRLGFGTHESDQNELSYLVTGNRQTGANDLARREATVIDMDPEHGGVVQVMAEDIVSFDLAYLDPVLNEWVDQWDTSQTTGQYERLPAQVRIDLVLTRPNADPYRFVTKVPLAMQAPLVFGIPTGI